FTRYTPAHSPAPPFRPAQLKQRRMKDPMSRWLRRALRWAIVLLALLGMSSRALGNGADLPPEIVLRAFVKVDGSRAHLIVRVPSVPRASFRRPKRGPGYTDFSRADAALKRAAAATSRQIELSVDGTTLVPSTREIRVSLLSDRSFASYDNALKHLQ